MGVFAPTAESAKDRVMFFSSGSTSAVLQTRRHPLWSGCAASGVGIMGIQNLEIGVVDALDHLLMAPGDE